MFTSDYALYWFDYFVGYDTVFVELGWNHDTLLHIALGRGAVNLQEKIGAPLSRGQITSHLTWQIEQKYAVKCLLLTVQVQNTLLVYLSQVS